MAQINSFSSVLVLVETSIHTFGLDFVSAETSSCAFGLVSAESKRQFRLTSSFSGIYSGVNFTLEIISDQANRLILIVPDHRQIVTDAYVSSMLTMMHENCPEGKRFNLQFINGDAASQLLKGRTNTAAAAAPDAMTPAPTVIFIANNGQIIQRQIKLNDFAAQAATMERPTERDEQEEVADRSPLPSPPYP